MDTPAQNTSAERLDRYELSEKLGVGGMARVYKAWDTQLQRYVAVKILHEHLADDATFKDRFEREAQFVAGFNHPNIVQVYDFSRARWRGDDHYYMVMPYIAGESLRDVIERHHDGGMADADILRVMHDMTEALGYAHERGMVHRDVKPGNILMDSSGRAILTDFGIARMTSAARVTQAGLSTGTPAYMSPEQANGEAGDARSDLYSLAIILYEMITGQTPYQDDSNISLMLKHVTQPVPLPSSVLNEQNDGLDEFMQTALAKNPDDRFQTAREMMVTLLGVYPEASAPYQKLLEEARTATSRPSPVRSPKLITGVNPNQAEVGTLIISGVHPQAPTQAGNQTDHKTLYQTVSALVRAHPKTSTGFFVFIGAMVLLLVALVVVSRATNTIGAVAASDGSDAGNVAEQQVALARNVFFRSTFRATDRTLGQWPTGVADQITRALLPETDTYQLSTDRTGIRLTTLPDNGSVYGDVGIDLEATITAESAPATATGIIFRYQDEANYNVFTVDGRGRFSIWALQNGEWRELRNPETSDNARLWTRNDAVHPQGEANKLRVDVRGNLITAQVNLREVVRLTDSTFPDGRIGIYLGTDDESATINVDGFSASDTTSSMTGG